MLPKSLLKRRTFWLILALAVLSLGFVGIGHLDKLIPGRQLVFLAPNGKVVPLNSTAGKPDVADIKTPLQLTEANQISLAPMAHWGSWAVVPVRQSGSIGLQIKKLSKTNNEFGKFIPFNSNSGHDFVWVGSDLYFVGDNGIRKISAVENSDSTIPPGVTETVKIPGSWNGIFSTRNSSGWKIASWNDNSIWIGDTLGGQEHTFGSNGKIAAAGIGASGGWVVLHENGNISWQAGATDKISVANARFLPDASGKGILLWDRSSGNLYRLMPSGHALVATALTGVTTSAAGGDPKTILLGGTLSEGVRASGDGFEHLGTFHHIGNGGIASFFMDPQWISSNSINANFTFSFISPAGAPWSLKLLDSNGMVFKEDSGLTTTTGIIAKSESASNAPQGKCKAVLSLFSADTVDRDTLIFLSDKTPPAGIIGWSGSQISPTNALVINLANVIDDGDALKPVYLVAKWGDGSEFKIIKPENGTIQINGKDPATGAWLPEGSWAVTWYLSDSVGNRRSVENAPSLTIRTTSIQARASFDPTFVNAGLVNGKFNLELSEVSSNAPVNAKVFSSDVQVGTNLAGVTSQTGTLSLSSQINLGNLAAGVCTLQVKGTAGIDSFQSQSQIIVGSLQSRITWPQAGSRIAINESFPVWGIAPDLWPSISGNSIYRVSVHQGAWAAPVNATWSDLERAKGSLLLVNPSYANSSPTLLARDIAGYPGSVGSTGRISQDANLAVLRGSDIAPGDATLALWIGKGDSLRVATLGFQVISTTNRADSTFALKRVSVSSELNRADADTSNDRIRWVLHKGKFNSVDLSVRCGSSNEVVYTKSAAIDSVFDFSGIDGLGRPIPDNSCVLRIEGNASGQQASREDAFSIIAFKPKLNLSVSNNFDASLAVFSGKSAQLPIYVSNPRGDRFRLHLYAEDGSGLGVIDSSSQQALKSIWNGKDSLGRNLFAAGSSRSVSIGLEHLNGLIWQNDTTASVNISAHPIEQADLGLQIDGYNLDTQRIATLHSDWRIKARLEGSLAYFPKRDVEFRIYPEGQQTARRYLPVDYAMEWAKYYTSIAGYTNWKANWRSMGYRLGIEWTDTWIPVPYFVWRTPTENRERHADGVPFWYFSHSNSPGIGKRRNWNVVNFDSNSPINDTTMVGTAPYFDQNRGMPIVQVEKNNTLYKFDASKFFGDGINEKLENVESANRNFDEGYSGYLEGSPFDGFINARWDEIRGTIDSVKFGLIGRNDAAVAVEDYSLIEGETKYSHRIPEARENPLKDRNLVAQIGKKSGAALLCKNASITAWIIEDYANTTIPVNITYLSPAALRDSLYQMRDSSFVDSVSSQERYCHDSSILALSESIKRDPTTTIDTIVDFQQYLDSLAVSVSNNSWKGSRNVGAIVDLTRPWVGFTDDAHFDPLPESWQQYHYLLPPGRLAVDKDEASMLLEYNTLTSSTNWERSSDSFDGKFNYSIVGAERILPFSTFYENDGAWDDFTCTGDGYSGQPNWYFTNRSIFGASIIENYGYRYSCGIARTQMPGTSHSDTSGTYQGKYGFDLSLRTQHAFTPPPGIRWDHPWFTLHNDSTTVVRRILYADDSVVTIPDGIRWSYMASGKATDSLSTYGGYKNGQVGYWFKPAKLLQDSGRYHARQFPINSHGQKISEVNWVSGYRNHVHPDTTYRAQWSNQDIAFTPRLIVNDTTRGVVWDTTSIAWPDIHRQTILDRHIDRRLLADTGARLDSTDLGRTWGRWQVQLSPDSLWIPSSKSLTTAPVGVAQTQSARSLIPNLPDQKWTGLGSGKRIDSLISYVHAENLNFGIIPLYRDMILDGQGKVIWSDSATKIPLSWSDAYAHAQLSTIATDHKLSAAYGYTPDTLGFWSSGQDSMLASTNGWIGLQGQMSQNAYQPVATGLKLLPVSNDINAPCYRPWVTNAFVRIHDSSNAACSDNITLNPNLFHSNTKWNLDIFAPDGQTPNTDLGARGIPTLQSVSLALDAGRSSRRWIRVRGVIPTARLLDSDAVPWMLEQWHAYAIGDTGINPLELQIAWTDSSDRTKGVRTPGKPTLWASNGDSDVVWMDVTGLYGSQKIAVSAQYSRDGIKRRIVQILPYVVGEPRRSDSSKVVSDAYRRALLTVPPSSTDARPVVLNTIAGKDLASLPLGGVVPAGPVISMQPSGMRFDSAPATLRYSLTLREVLALSGNSVPDTQTVFEKASLNPTKVWASSNLSIWLLSQDGKIEKAPTNITTDGDTTSSSVLLDGYRFDLLGKVTHFSWAMVLSGDVKKNISPTWRIAVADAQGMQVSLGFSAWKNQNLAYPNQVHIYTADREIDWFLSASQGRADTTVSWSKLSASVQDLWRAGALTLYARVDSGTISSRSVDGASWTPSQDTCSKLTHLTLNASPLVLPAGQVTWQVRSTLQAGTQIFLIARSAGTSAWVRLDSITSTDDTILGGHFSSNEIAKGTWILRAINKSDSTCFRDTTLKVIVDSLGLALTLDQSDILVGTSAKLQIASIPGVIVSVLQDSAGTRRTIRNSASLVTGSWKTQISPQTTDSLVFWLKGQGVLGGIDSIRQVLHVHALQPQWLHLVRNVDTLHPDWAPGVLYRHRWEDSVKLQWSTRNASEIKIVGKQNGYLVVDTVLAADNISSWSFKPSAKHSLRFVLRLSMRNRVADTFTADTTFAWQIEPPPAAVVWGGTRSNLEPTFQNAIASHGINITSLDSSDQLSDWFASRPKGTAIFLDSVLPAFVWGGAERGQLMPWVRNGGNVVFSGAPAFAARDSQGITIPAGIGDARRVSIYGFDPVTGSYELYQRFISGIRMDGVKAISEDAFAKRSWNSMPSTLAPATRLRWFDSAGIAIDPGFLGNRIDSQLTVKDTNGVKDSIWKRDTVLAGGLLYFPPLLETKAGLLTRKGAIVELPALDAQNVASAGAFVYNTLFVPDLGIGDNDILLSYATKGARNASQWKPIRGDTVALRVRVHLRDGGVLDSLDSVRVHVKVDGLLTDTILVAHHVLAGVDTSSEVKFIIPDTSKFGDHLLSISVDTLRTNDLMGKDYIESYLRNNVISRNLDVGELSLPTIRWIDSTQMIDDRAWRRLRPLAPGASITVPTKAWAAVHNQAGWKEWYKLNSVVSTLAQDSSTSLADTAAWDLPVKVGINAENQQKRNLVLVAQDRYGNVDSSSLQLSVDAVLPLFKSIRISGLTGIPNADSSSDTIWSFMVPKDSVSKDKGLAHLHLEASDDVGLDSITYGPERWSKNLWAVNVSLDTSVPVNMNTDSKAVPMVLRIIDLAGNVSKRLITVSTDTGAPNLMLGRMRIRAGSVLQYQSVVDTFLSHKMSKDSLGKVLKGLAANGNNLFQISGNVPQVQWAQAGQSGSHDTLQQLVRKGDTVDLLLMANDQSAISGHGLWTMTTNQHLGRDSVMLVSPYLRDTATWLQGHPNQWLYRVIADNSEIELHALARDTMGNVRSTVIYLVDSSADLQVVDSANDRCKGADLGEVYMRQSHGVIMKGTKIVQDTSIWTHWLMQINNSATDKSQWGAIRVYVDADNDSTTGIQSGSLQGADSALELLRSKATDDGTGAYVRKLAWSNGVWTPVTKFLPEGRWDSLGVSQFGNHADDPSTATVGTGSQQTPWGTLARPEIGTWEIGWKLGHGNKIQTLRWAIITADSCGDTVLDTNDRMFHFRPLRFKNVTVDGLTSDWKNWNGNTQLITYSADTVSSTSVRTGIALRNVGLAAIEGFQVSYYCRSATQPSVSWDSSGRAANFAGQASLDAPQRLWDASGDSSYWKITIHCSECIVGTGAELFRFGTIVRDGVTSNLNDWSANGNRLLPNAKLPTWLNSGTLIWGVEPPLQGLRPASGLDSVPSTDTLKLPAVDDSVIGSDTIQSVSYGNSGTFGGLSYLESWYLGGDIRDSISWLDSTETSCAAISPIQSSKILRMGFQGSSLLGLKFGTSDTSLLSRYSNLEFWVAASRDWPSRRDRDIPVRIWLTHQIKPGSGDDNNTSEEDFTYLQAFLPTGHLAQKWQKVSIPLNEIFQNLNSNANGHADSLYLKFMLDNSGANGDIDSARRADLLLSGMRFVKYGAGSMISTRRVGAVLVGESARYDSFWNTSLNPRFVNVSGTSLSMDSLRLTFPFYSVNNASLSFDASYNRQGTDESVDNSWFNPIQYWATSSHIATINGRRSNRSAILTWAGHAYIQSLRGWQAEWRITLNNDEWVGWLDSVYGNSIQAFLPDYSNSFSFLSGVVAEYRQPDGSMKRLWGAFPGEKEDTIHFLLPKNLHRPSDTILPIASWRSLHCTDSGTSSGSIDTTVVDTTHNGADTSLQVSQCQSTGAWSIDTWTRNGSTAARATRNGTMIHVPFSDSATIGVQLIAGATGWDPVHEPSFVRFKIRITKPSIATDLRFWVNRTNHYASVSPIDDPQGFAEYEPQTEDYLHLSSYLRKTLDTAWQWVQVPLSVMRDYPENSAVIQDRGVRIKWMRELDMGAFNTLSSAHRFDLELDSIQIARTLDSVNLGGRVQPVSLSWTRDNESISLKMVNSTRGTLLKDGYSSPRIWLRFPGNRWLPFFTLRTLVDQGPGQSRKSSLSSYSRMLCASPVWNDGRFAKGCAVDAVNQTVDWPTNDDPTIFFPAKGVVLEYRPTSDSAYRLWGTLPDENADTLHWWNPDGIGRSLGVVPKGCGDIDTSAAGGSGGPTGGNPTSPAQVLYSDSTAGTSISNCASCSMTVKDGIPMLAVKNSGGERIFDLNLLVSREIQTSTSVSVSVQFDAETLYSWQYAELISVNPASNRYWQANRVGITPEMVNRMITLTFPWDGSSMPLGSQLILKLALNVPGNAWIANLRFNGGSADANSSPADTITSVVTNAGLLGLVPSAVQALCNGCQPTIFDGIAASKVEGLGGNPLLSIEMPTDAAMQAAQHVAVEIRLPACSLGNWEYMELVRTNHSVPEWWGTERTTIPASAASTWTSIRFPWSGGVLPFGSATTLKLAVNANCSDIYLSNLRLLP